MNQLVSLMRFAPGAVLCLLLPAFFSASCAPAHQGGSTQQTKSDAAGRSGSKDTYLALGGDWEGQEGRILEDFAKTHNDPGMQPQGKDSDRLAELHDRDALTAPPDQDFPVGPIDPQGGTSSQNQGQSGSSSSNQDGRSGSGADVSNPKEYATNGPSKNIPGATIGTSIEGDYPSEQNQATPFIPASIMKVVTTAIAFKTMGPDFKYTTTVKWTPEASGATAKDVTIFADGDPQPARGEDGPAESRIKEIAANLKNRGIKKLTGAFTLATLDARRDVAIPADGVETEDNLACYGAVSQAFNFRWNCGGLMVSGVNKGDWSDPDLAFPVQFQMQSGSKTAISTKLLLDALGRTKAFLIHGTWAAGSARGYGIALPIADAKSWYGNAVLTELKKQGVDVSDVKPTLVAGAEAAKLWSTSLANVAAGPASFQLYSKPLSELVVHMNKPSDNFLADTLFRTYASKHSSRTQDLRVSGSLAAKEAIEFWMARNGHREYASEIKVVDGSGLSRSNRTTPRAFLALLTEFSKEPSFRHLWHSLPIAGKDGTLEGRMVGTRAQGVVRAKTGTLRGSYQLAGYVPKLDASGNPVAFVPFVILSKADPANRNRVKAMQNQLVVRLMNVINPPAGSGDTGPRRLN